MTTYQPPYTAAQLAEYVSYINLPPKYHPRNSPPRDISLLTALHVHQITTIPYENLDLHYSVYHSISLSPTATYHKLIDLNSNRGGYCMENTLFFLWMLQAYGFDVYPTGVRIRLRSDGKPAGEYIGLVHIVLIVTFENGEKYISDVAFGGDGMTSPQRLVANSPVVNLGTQENRFIYDILPQNPPRKFSAPQKYWIWEYRNSPTAEWNAFYCFTEDEYLLGDYEVMNWYTSSGKTMQRKLVLVIKFLRGKDEGGEAKVVGKVMLVGDVMKRNLGGRTEVVDVCRNEEERVRALEKWFGIVLTREERKGIRGLPTELVELKSNG